jgi:hypothetical protein
MFDVFGTPAERTSRVPAEALPLQVSEGRVFPYFVTIEVEEDVKRGVFSSYMTGEGEVVREAEK